MSLKLRHLVLVLFALIIAGAVSAEPAVATVSDPAFPHVAVNQNRFAAQVITHAAGCTICRDACTDADIGVIFPCHCTDYQECGDFEDSGCFPGWSCAGGGNLTCVPADWYNGCDFIFSGASAGSCQNC